MLRHVTRFMWVISLRLLYAWFSIYKKKCPGTSIEEGKLINIVMTCFKKLAERKSDIPFIALLICLINDIDDVNNSKFDYFAWFFRFNCTRRIKGFTNRDITFLYDSQDRFWNTLLEQITLIWLHHENLTNGLSLI